MIPCFPDFITLSFVILWFPVNLSKIEDYEKQICDFFNFKSIYEYDDTSLMPTLFSKSKAFVAQEKEKKMNDFWLKCSIYSFSQINNPYEYNRDLLIELLKQNMSEAERVKADKMLQMMQMLQKRKK